MIKFCKKLLFSTIKYTPEYPININNASETEQNKHTNKTCLPIKP